MTVIQKKPEHADSKLTWVGRKVTGSPSEE